MKVEATDEEMKHLKRALYSSLDDAKVDVKTFDGGYIELEENYGEDGAGFILLDALDRVRVLGGILENMEVTKI